MKKLFLALMFVMAFASSCFAYQPNPNTWQWVTSNERTGFFMERKPVQVYTYSYGERDLTVWCVQVNSAANKHTVLQQRFKYRGKTSAILYFAEYNSSTGELLHSGSVKRPTYDPIIPGSMGDSLYQFVCRKAGLRPY